MKTIEQHLQELFVGKTVKIRMVRDLDKESKPIWTELIGVVKHYKISLDYIGNLNLHYVSLVANSSLDLTQPLSYALCPFSHVFYKDTIEIL